MNFYCGIVRFDGCPVSEPELEQCAVLSPQWSPDAQRIVVGDSVGFQSTQRFTTPECKNGPLPYQDRAAGLILNGDLYLTHRSELGEKLSADPLCADAELVLRAYQTWGPDCVEHLFGTFSFAIWDAVRGEVFLATDHYGSSPCFYSSVAGRHVFVANTMAPFYRLLQAPSLNQSLFEHFALDALCPDETCWREVKKLEQGHCLLIGKQRFEKRRYWHLRRRHLRGLHTREYYMTKFRRGFQHAVAENLRGRGSVATHLSGGLDSSSVTAMASVIQRERGASLHAFTAAPRELRGASYRHHWRYDEAPQVQALLRMHPHISHRIYDSSSVDDPFTALQPLYSLIDQPFRNVSNLGWIMASFQYAREQGCSILLNGQSGNGSISWRGEHWLEWLRATLQRVLWRAPAGAAEYYGSHNENFMERPQTKEMLRRRCSSRAVQHQMVSGALLGPLQSTIRALALWYGVEYRDPTCDVPLLEYCYQLPQWVFYRGRGVEHRRLLVRRGLRDLLPSEIYENSARGEQSADWYLTFNEHVEMWRQRVERLPVDHLVWRLYDRPRILRHFKPIVAPTVQNTTDVKLVVLRFLSSVDFLDELTTLQGRHCSSGTERCLTGPLPPAPQSSEPGSRLGVAPRLQAG